jgi:flagellar biosynthesis/type III secretory pathway protein FliH
VTPARIVQRAQGTVIPPAAAIEPRTIERLTREELEARETAARTLVEAKQSAAAILDEARAKASSVAQTAAREAAEAEQAKLAAQFLAMRVREERSADKQIDRSVELARVLAERLLGEALRVEAETIAKLARQALAEAQGARTVRIEAHPDDLAALERHVALLNIAQVASIVGDATLERGCLRLHTDLGTIDAKLRPQLERLAAALRDALRA